MNKNVLLRKIRYLIPLFVLVCIGIYIYKYNVIFVDSDASSGLLFAKEIAKTGNLLPDTWYYSTTIFLLDYPIVYALMFLISSNWLIVRVTGTVIILFLYLLCAYYLLKTIGIKHKVITLVLLLMPFSIVYFGMYIAMPYYAFTNIKIFLSLAIAINLFKTDNLRKKRILLSVFCILVFIQGIDGFRNIVLFVIPMILTTIIFVFLNGTKKDNLKKVNDNKKLATILLIIIVSCSIGYVINYLITKQLDISSYSNANYATISSDVIVQEFNSWLDVFGYTRGEVFSLATLHNLASFILIILSAVSVIWNIKHKEEIEASSLIMSLFYLFGVFILIVFGLFIDFNQMGLYDLSRYNIPIVVLSIPLIISWFENIECKNIFNRYLFVCFFSLMVIVGLDNYRLARINNKEVLSKINSGRVNNNTAELNDIVYQLKEKGYRNGYSYFWCGNVVTELSNGEIEMWVLGSGGNHTKNLDDLSIRYRWLQSKDHDVTEPTGKTFIIFNKEELDYSLIAEKLDWKNVIYDSNNYTVYGYESNEKLKKDFYN